jgi:hypothetical protein
VLTLLFVLWLGTFGCFATDYFTDFPDLKSPNYNQLHEELHFDKFILSLAEVEEVEEEADEDNHELLPVGYLDYSFYFSGNYEVKILRTSDSIYDQYPHTPLLFYLFRNIRI